MSVGIRVAEAAQSIIACVQAIDISVDGWQQAYLEFDASAIRMTHEA